MDATAPSQPRRGPRPLKHALRAWSRWLRGQIGASLSTWIGRRAGPAFGILMYHRIADADPNQPVPTWNVTPARFRAQLAGLLTRGYRAWPLRRVLAATQAGSPIPPRTFVVTFDDGYENVHRAAWPILRELDICATVFVATAFLDRAAPFPFDDWSLAGSPCVPAHAWRPMTTAQGREMLHSGLIDLGSHTHTHQLFIDRPEAFRADLQMAAQVLRERFGLTDAPFAFPFGRANAALTAEVRRAGLLCALTTRGTLVRPGEDAFAWGRFTVEQADTAGTLAAQLDGWCSLARPTRRLAPIIREKESQTCF